MTVTPTYQQPDTEGFFGRFGGSFISETLAQAVEELVAAWQRYRDDPAFIAEYEEELADYVGRPSPIYYARRLSEETGGARILLKREDLNHTGAHKINNVIGQAMLARRMGKRRIIAETGAGQAWRGHCDDLRALRPGMRDLHGQRGHRAATPQCPAHGAARRNRDPCRLRQPHAQGRDERRDPRLGQQRR